jgi:hypothetical protein
MNSPTDEYRFMKNIDNIWDIAYFTLFEKYIIYNLRGEEKKIEIDSTDQESIIMTKNMGYPLPGITYTFIYKGPNVIIKNPKLTKEYTDWVPLVFCMNTSPGHFSGINFNVLPPPVRLQFLQSFYDTFIDFLEREVDVLAQNNKLALNKRFIAYIKSGKGQNMIKLFNRQNGENFNFGYRKYSIEKIDNFRMVEYSEWKYIPFYSPTDAFRKLNQSQIYKLYGQSEKDI